VGLVPPVDFAMESGYINVTATDYLFYWYQAAAPSAPADAPVLVWSNGGPGCSAMEGATTEGGAVWLFNAKQSGTTGFAGDLSRNAYSWNAQAHLVFVDQPRYVGFSTGTGEKVRSSAAAGVDMVQFLLGWRAAYPEHAHRNIILASESYGGHCASLALWVAALSAGCCPSRRQRRGRWIDPRVRRRPCVGGRRPRPQRALVRSAPCDGADDRQRHRQ
jgi:carboxypeptidase C (cathepsin A)